MRPDSPWRTCATVAASGKLQRTTSARSATSRAERAGLPPYELNRDSAAAETSKPVTECPDSSRWRDMGLPIAPKPTSPMSTGDSWLSTRPCGHIARNCAASAHASRPRQGSQHPQVNDDFLDTSRQQSYVTCARTEQMRAERTMRHRFPGLPDQSQ